MGNRGSRKISEPEYEDFCPLRIATLYADIDESINKKKQIEIIVNYFLRSYYGYKLDVLCIQGIRSYKILKELVCAFKKRIEKHNDDHRHTNPVYLEYFPDVECDKFTDNEIYWSTSEADYNILYYDKLIISRHNILQSADVQIGTNKKDLRLNDAGLMTNNMDSEEIVNIYRYVQIVNLNVDGTFISLYNVELEDDTIGISNIKERRIQINDIKEVIETNRRRTINPEMRKFIYGDNTFIATNRDIHILTGMFHINEIKNGSLSSEYNKTIALLNCMDTHKWIANLRKKNIPSVTNVRFTKDTYTLLVSKNLWGINDVTLKSQKLFEEHKTVIINSNVAVDNVDVNQFTNYPEDTIFMLYRPNIELFNNRILSLNSHAKKSKKKSDIYTTRFMDQTIIDNIRGRDDQLYSYNSYKIEYLNRKNRTTRDDNKIKYRKEIEIDDDYGVHKNGTQINDNKEVSLHHISQKITTHENNITNTPHTITERERINDSSDDDANKEIENIIKMDD